MDELSSLTGFIEALQATPNIVNSFTLCRLQESCAVGAAALGAKDINQTITLDYDKMIIKFYPI